MPFIIKGASGLGDNIYLNPIVKHFSEIEKDVKVVTKFPELYRDIKCEPITQSSIIHKYCSYVNQKTSNRPQYEDMLVNAGVNVELKLHLTLKPNDSIINFVNKVKNYIFVSDMYKPGFVHDMDMRPDPVFMANKVKELKEKHNCEAYIFGKGGQLIKGCDDSLYDYTTTDDILYLIKNATMVFGQVGYIIPASEVFDKECLYVLSMNYKLTNQLFVNTIKPEKLNYKSTTKGIYEN